MKFTLDINNQTTQKISKKTLLEVFKATLRVADFVCLENKNIELSAAFVSKEEMQVLNRQYRKKDRPTDVLSFGEYENSKKVCENAIIEKNGDFFLGEIILCPEYIAGNAQEDGETFEYALNYIFSHGILHLLGFDHGKKMFSLQKFVADTVK